MLCIHKYKQYISISICSIVVCSISSYGVVVVVSTTTTTIYYVCSYIEIEVEVEVLY